MDGEDNFNFVADQCKKLSSKYSKDNVIIVSIGYGHNRTLDYTPTKAPEGQGGAPAGEFPSDSGSAIDPGSRTNDQSNVLPRSGSGQGIPSKKSPSPNNNPMGQSSGSIGQSTGLGSNSSQGTGSSGVPPGR